MDLEVQVDKIRKKRHTIMAQRLVILNRLDKKPMNTIFVKEQGYTFPAISYLDNFVKSIVKYCEDYSANTVSELFQKACYFATPALSEKDDEEIEYIEKLLGQSYDKPVNPDDYYCGVIAFTKDIMQTDLDMAEITLIVDWVFTDGKLNLEETKVDLKNAFYGVDREDAISSELLDAYEINKLEEDHVDLGSVPIDDLLPLYESLPNAWLETCPEKPDKNIIIAIQ